MFLNFPFLYKVMMVYLSSRIGSAREVKNEMILDRNS